MDLLKKAVEITDVGIKELSFIFGEHKGERWSPINADARVITVKGAPVIDEARKAKSFLGNFWEKVTSGFSSKAASADETLQNALEYASYDILGSLVYSLQWDLYAIFNLDDVAFPPDQKKAAVQRVFDGFTAEMAKIIPLFLGEAELSSLIDKAQMVLVEKGGKRHSKADLEHIDAMKTAHKTMGDHLDALTTDKEDKKDGGADETDEQKAARVQAEKDAADKAAAEKAAADAASQAVPAEPDNKGQRVTPPADNGGAASDAIAAQITAAVTKASTEFDAKLADAKKASDDQISAVEKAAQERVEKAEQEAVRLRADLETANNSIKALVGEARTPSSSGFVSTTNEDGTRNDPAKESTKAEVAEALKGAKTIGEVIKLQRIAHS